jgi:hypothetical protein
MQMIIGASFWNWKELIFKCKKIKKSWGTLIKVQKFRAYFSLLEKKVPQIRAIERTKYKANCSPHSNPRTSQTSSTHTVQKAATAVISKPAPCSRIKISPKIKPFSSTNKFLKCQFWVRSITPQSFKKSKILGNIFSPSSHLTSFFLTVITSYQGGHLKTEIAKEKMSNWLQRIKRLIKSLWNRSMIPQRFSRLYRTLILSRLIRFSMKKLIMINSYYKMILFCKANLRWLRKVKVNIHKIKNLS